MADANLPPPINGTEQRLDALLAAQAVSNAAVLDELRAIRAKLVPVANQPEGTVPLREPKPSRRQS